MIERLLTRFFKSNLTPFEYPDLPTKFLTKKDMLQFTEQYVTPEVTIPEGFITDGASTPRWLQSLYPPFYKYTAAAVVHDYLYGEGEWEREECDKLFRDIMRYRLKLSWRYWLVMYIGVRLGGSSHYTRRNIEGNTVVPVTD